MRARSSPWVLLLVIGPLALLGATSASAAHPKRSAHFSGSGRLCENNAAGHRYTACAGRDRFSWQTSADGSRVMAFSGVIGPIYCGGVTSTVTIQRMHVSSDGKFSAHFSSPNVVSGKTNGISHVVVRGRFTTARTGRVFYRIITHFNKPPGSADCGAQVSGIAHSG